MSVSPSFQGKPVDLKAEIAGLTRPLIQGWQRYLRKVFPHLEKRAVVVHPGVGGVAVGEDQVQLNTERQGGHLDAKEGECKV